MKQYSRQKARAAAVQVMFEWQFAANDIAVIKNRYLETLNPKKVDVAYFQDLVMGVVQHLEVIDEIIIPVLDRKFTELNQVEKAILRLAVYELKYHLEVPYKVVINEALELAKTFGSIEGYKYVNGVLDKIVQATKITQEKIDE